MSRMPPRTSLFPTLSGELLIMSERQFNTLRDLLYWSYANLQMADAASSMHKDKYDRVCYAIRAKAYKSYMDVSWHISDLYRQQIEKLQKSNHACAYCGKILVTPKEVTIDHIFPRIKGGTNEMENIVFACKNCNSSKGDKDMFGWYIEHFGKFPTIFLTANYLKKVYLYAQTNDLLDLSIETLNEIDLPFDWHCIPTKYPQPSHFITNKNDDTATRL